VIAELAQYHKQSLQDAASQIETHRREFERRGLTAPVVTWPTPLGDLLEQLPQRLTENLAGYGAQILDNLTVDQERLLLMAVRKKPPFTIKGEKGFRDSVILITMLQHCRNQGWKEVLIVTNDGPIVEACGTLPEAEGIEVAIARSIEEAAGQIADFVDASFKRWEESRKTACKQYLIDQRGSIEEFVRRQVAFTETSFRNREPGETVEEVHVLRLVDLDVSALGEQAPKQNEGPVRFTASAEIEVDATITRLRWPPEKQFRVGEPPEDPATAAILGQMAFVKQLRATVKVEGQVHVKRADGKEQFSELSLESAAPEGGLGSIWAWLAERDPEVM